MGQKSDYEHGRKERAKNIKKKNSKNINGRVKKEKARE